VKPALASILKAQPLDYDDDDKPAAIPPVDSAIDVADHEAPIVPSKGEPQAKPLLTGRN
jgi:hypothetical protein